MRAAIRLPCLALSFFICPAEWTDVGRHLQLESASRSRSIRRDLLTMYAPVGGSRAEPASFNGSAELGDAMNDERASVLAVRGGGVTGRRVRKNRGRLTNYLSAVSPARQSPSTAARACRTRAVINLRGRGDGTDQATSTAPPRSCRCGVCCRAGIRRSPARSSVPTLEPNPSKRSYEL